MMDDKEKFIQKVFNSIAQDYDKMNLLLTGGFFPLWQNKLLKELRAHKGDQILDLCCGSGTLTLKIARQLEDKETSWVTGLDFSEKMLEKAVEKSQQTNLPVDFILGDALNLEFEPESFNKVINTFALRNLSSIEKAFEEIFKVLKKDGQVYILEVSRPDNKIIRFFFEIYYYKIVPLLGRLADGGRRLDGQYSPYEWLSQSLKDFPEKNQLKEILAEKGFSKITHKNYGFGGISLFIAKK